VLVDVRESGERLAERPEGGARLDPDHQLPRGLEKQIESASRASIHNASAAPRRLAPAPAGVTAARRERDRS